MQSRRSRELRAESEAPPRHREALSELHLHTAMLALTLAASILAPVTGLADAGVATGEDRPALTLLSTAPADSRAAAGSLASASAKAKATAASGARKPGKKKGKVVLAKPQHHKCHPWINPCEKSGKCPSLVLTKSAPAEGADHMDFPFHDNLVSFESLQDPGKLRAKLRGKHLRIRLVRDWCDSAGFYTYPLYAINQIRVAERYGLIADKKPFVYMPETNIYFQSCIHRENRTIDMASDDTWTEYFEPISTLDPERVPDKDVWEFSQETIKNIFHHKDSVHAYPYSVDGSRLYGEVGTQNWISCHRKRGVGLIKKYVNIREDLLLKANSFFDENIKPGERILGVHMKGPDKWINGPWAPRRYSKYIKRFFERFPRRGKVFIISNKHRYLARLMGKYGDGRVITHNEWGIHWGEKATQTEIKQVRGRNVLIDTLMLARSDKLIKSWSSIPEFANYFALKYRGALFKARGRVSKLRVVDLELARDPLADDTSTCFAGYRCEDVAPQFPSFKALNKAIKGGSCSRRCARHRAYKNGYEPAASMAGGKSVALVVARYKEDTAWLAKQPFCYVVVEKQGSGFDKGKDKSLVVVNKGNEASTYLKFINENYADLPDNMIFTHADAKSEHAFPLAPMLNTLNVDAYGYASLNGISFPFVEHDDLCDIYTFWTQEMHDAEKFTPKTFLDLSMACCAQFVVSKPRVLGRPRAVYERLYNYSTGSTDFGHSTDYDADKLKPSTGKYTHTFIPVGNRPEPPTRCDKKRNSSSFSSFDRGEVLELTWHKIFGESWHSQQLDPARLCGSAERCPQDLPVVHDERVSSYGVVENPNDEFWYPAGEFIAAHDESGVVVPSTDRYSLVMTPTSRAADLRKAESLAASHKLHGAGDKYKPPVLGVETPVAQTEEAVSAISRFAQVLACDTVDRYDVLKILLWNDNSCGADFFGLRVEPWLQFDGCGVPIRFYSSSHIGLVDEMDAVMVPMGERSEHLPGVASSGQVWASCSLDDRAKGFRGKEGSLLQNEHQTSIPTASIGVQANATIRISKFSNFYLGRSKRSVLRKPAAMPWVEKIPRVLVMEDDDCDRERSWRNRYVRQLRANMDRISFVGKCWHDTKPVSTWKPRDDGRGPMGMHLNRIANMRPYMFTLIHESSSRVMTERVYQALAAGSVPIYRGMPGIEGKLPCKNCVINADEYPSARALAKHVSRLLDDREAYEKLVSWKHRRYDPREHPEFERVRQDSVDTAVCRFASQVLESRNAFSTCGDTCMQTMDMWQRIAPTG